MKITIESDNEIVSIETKKIIPVYEFLDILRRLSLAIGYSADSVNEAFD